MAEAGKPAEEVFRAVNERWGIEYPATNNAVVNGGIVATSVWFGKGDFLTTENLAFTAADFADTDCNAANAASVVGAMHGMSALPAGEVAALNDRIYGATMGPLKLTPPVDESISALGRADGGHWRKNTPRSRRHTSGRQSGHSHPTTHNPGA